MCCYLHGTEEIKYYNSLRFDNVTRHGCRHKIKMQEDTLQGLRDYLQNKHMKDKHKDLPNEWKLYSMCKVPQQDTTNTTDCGVFVCIYCNLILNDCKVEFSQNNITNSNWRDRMILLILSIKPKNDKENNNDDKVTLSAIKMKWNKKQKNIARASTWSTNLIMKRIAKQARKTRWIVMMIAMVGWIAKTKEYKNVHEKSRSKTNTT
jgi:hypothetical protein